MLRLQRFRPLLHLTDPVNVWYFHLAAKLLGPSVFGTHCYSGGSKLLGPSVFGTHCYSCRGI